MRIRTSVASITVAVGLGLVLAASASAVPLPPPPPPPPPPTAPPGGQACPSDFNEPTNWLEVGVGVGNYLLGSSQSTAIPPGGPASGSVSTQSLLFGAGPTFLSITTQGCWGFDQQTPQSLSTSPFWLMYWTTSSWLDINGVYLVPVDQSSPPTLVVGDDGSLTATGPDTRYDIEAPSNGSANGPLSVVGRVDLRATPYLWDPGSGHLGHFGPSPLGPAVGGQPITGGEIYITNTINQNCLTPGAHVTASVPLPGTDSSGRREFSVGPSSGLPPTGEVDYGDSLPVICGSSGSGGGGGGGGGGGTTKPCGGHHCVESADVGPRAHSWRRVVTHARTGSGLRANLSAGLSQPVHLSVSDLYLGGLHIQNAFLNYDPSTDLWTGGGDMQLGDASIHAAPPPPNEGFGIHGNGDFAFGGASYTFPATSQPVLFSGPPPVTLSEIGVTFALHPTTLSGDATLSVAGGEVTIHGSVLVVFGDPNEPYTYQPGALQGVGSLQIGSTPITSFAAGISGIVDLNGLPGVGGMQLGNGYVFYMSPGYFEFAGDVSQSVLGVTADGHVQGQLDLHNHGQYNLAGSLSVCADFPVVGSVCAGSLSAVVSSTGIGACGQFAGITGGFTYHWGDSFPNVFGGVFLNCNDELSPVTVVVQPARDAVRASAAHAAGPVGFDLPGGVPSTVAWVRGSNGPPLVTITGPHGEQLGNATPGQGAESAGLVVWPEPKLKETLIEIRRPGAGRWTITPLPGSPAITSVSYANSLPPAKISATVRGHGSTRTLRYQVRPRAGQTVTFVERAAGVFHVLGHAAAERGSLGFTPAFGPGRRRQIIAMIAVGGVPRNNIVVARYTAAAPAPPITPTAVRVLRAGRGLTVSWSPADRWGCLVVATLSDGERRLFTMRPNQRSLKIAKLAPGVGARITVSDLGPTGNTSIAAVATAPPTRPGPVTGVTIGHLGRRLAISWHRATGARRYIITISLGGRRGITLLGITLKPDVTLKQDAPLLLARGAVARISIRGLDLGGHLGPAGNATYTAPTGQQLRPSPGRGDAQQTVRGIA